MRNTVPQSYPQSMLPAFVCGVGWAIACVAWMISNARLGFTQGYPIVVIGPQLVVAFWSVIVFKEIRGKR